MGYEDAVILNDIGVVYEAMGKTDRARDAYLSAIARNPDYLPPYTNLGFLYESLGRRAAAVHYLKERLARAKQDDPWRGRIEQELLSLDPEYKAEKMRAESRKLEAALLEEARREFTMQIERAEGHLRRAEEALGAEKFDEASKELRRAELLTPGHPRIQALKERVRRGKLIAEIRRRTQEALARLQEGRLQDVEKEFQDILAIFPGRPDRAAP